MGAKVSMTKALLFASTLALRRVLAETNWNERNATVQVQVVRDFRDLGAILGHHLAAFVA